MPKRSEAYRESRKELIVQAAYQCFLRKGYQATSIADICREANVTVGTIYNYFASKRDIFLATQREASLQYAARPADRTWKKLKSHYIDLAMRLDDEQIRAQFRIVLEINVAALFDEELTRFAEKDIVLAEERLARQLSELRATGEIRLPLGVDVSARLINALIFEMASRRCWHPSRTAAEMTKELEQSLDVLVGACTTVD